MAATGFTSNTGTNLKSGISASLSTQIVIHVKDIDGHDIVVGAVQGLDEGQNRSLLEIGEIGSDGIIEIVPNKFTTYDIQLTRIMFDGIGLTQAFGRGFRNIHAQRFPFDIIITDQGLAQMDFSTSDVKPLVLTTYKNCWFSKMTTPYKVDNYIITQTASVKCEGIYTSMIQSGGAGASAVGDATVMGQRDLGISTDPIEKLVDSQRRLGALDFAGLINAAGMRGNNGSNLV